ncbi:MAG TPA: DNA internalization-related competence protein ComEC/Rec2, partial [Methylophilaceae bacterium]|nr:DNA internalization-related competence protein ComEC/Rec2 [Methylophilaceae bacterium]
LLAVVILDPWAVLSAGFWLSFGAVAIIAYALGGRIKRPYWLKEAIQVQWAISLGLVPLLLIMFNQISLISPLANALAIPLVSLVVVPLTLAGSLLQLEWLLNLAHASITACMLFLEVLVIWPVTTWQQQAPPPWAMFLAVGGVLWMLLPRGFPMRWLGLVTFMPLLLVRTASVPEGAMKVAVLDVGQGLAVVVRTAGHALLYDTGPRYSAQSDSGGRIVVPFLRGEGVKSLDGMVVSHDDNDHAGGMSSVLAQVPVRWVQSSLPQERMLGLPDTIHQPCIAGRSWTWDRVQFDMLHPTESRDGNRDKDNDLSCVLRVSSQYGSLLLPGDVERSAEHALLRTPMPSSDVLVVPHHGSKTSSTEPFVRKVKPRVAIFAVGYRNRFGHPKEDVVDRYRLIGSDIYRTDQDGALLIDFGQQSGIVVRRWRAEARRYWHDGDIRGAGLLAEIGAAR